MRRFLLITICLTYAFVAFAKPVSEKQALEKAILLMPGKTFRLCNVDANDAKSGNVSTPYYVFNAENNAGFVIVSSDDRTKAVLGYSDHGAIDMNNLPENVAAWLGYYAEAISSLQDSPQDVEYHTTATATTRRNIAPLIQSNWDQSSPFNNQCVFSGITCVTGCVATAMAQVMNYHKYPKTVPAIAGYTNGRTIPDLPAVTLDWANMCNTYFPYDERTDAQNNAVATLMRYCGQSVEMNYGTGSSGTTTGLASVALVKYFGYNKSVHAIYRDGYSEEGWENAIYQELSANYPIIYSGRTTTNAGHAFIVDGYKDGLYHVNWGWGSWCDGYFVLSVMDSHGSDEIGWTFSEDHSAIVGIRPTKGGTLDYPLMTISNLELTSSSEVTRGSANENFNASISFKMDNSVNSEEDKVGLGFALYKGDELVQSLAQAPVSSQRPGYYYTGSRTFYFGYNLTDGNYRIQAVYKDQYGNVHKAQGSDYRYIEAVIKGNKLTLTKYPLIGVVLDKSEVSILKGKTKTLKASVYPLSTDQSVTWKSSNTKVATVSSAGKVTGVKTGIVTITCTSKSTGQSATCKVTVGSIYLDKTEVSILKGTTLKLTPSVYPTTLEDKSVTWKSSNTKVATVTSDGEVKGVKTGIVTITCTSNVTGLSATCKVTVGSIYLNKTEVSILKGTTLKLTPSVYPTTLEDKSVTWKSSNTKVATVTADGEVKGVKTGIVTITCTSNVTGLSATCQVTVGSIYLDKTEVSILKGTTLKLTPSVYPTTLEDKSVTWKSSNTKVATVSSTGKVKGVKTGIVTITCTSNVTGLSATCKVTVGSIYLNKTEVSILKGTTLKLTPSVYPTTLEDKSVTWKSSNTKVATVTSDGEVKGVKTGIVTITCTSKATGLSATCEVIVGSIYLDKTEVSILKGTTLKLTPSVYPTTLTDKSVTWKSSNTKVATVTADGIVTGVTPGTATITCTSNATGLSATCQVTVTASSGTRSLSGDDDKTTGIEAVGEGEKEPYDVYDLSGRMVLHQVTSLEGLPNGVYIVNGRKVIKK